jgi:tetratricopeptide (TPR) repeat protein
VPLNATLVTGDWQLISPMLYLQSVEHVRPDVHLVQSGLLIRSWYLQPGKLREAIEAWEHGAPPTAAISELNRYFTELARSQRVFVTAEVTATRQLAPAMQELAKTHDFVPHGFAIEIAPGHQPRAVSKFTPRATPPPELAIRYREAFKRQARALMRAKRFDDAIAQYERALQIDPDDGETRYELGIARAQPALTAP